MRSLLALKVIVAAVLLGGVGAALAVDDEGRADDIARRRALYDQLPTFPGSRLVDEDVAEVTSDSGPVGEWMVTRWYSVPDDATAGEVLGHFRDGIPDGWRAADDRECADLADEGSLPLGDEWEFGGIMLQDSSTTLLTDADDPGRAERVGIRVATVLGERRLSIGVGEVSCGLEVEGEDRAAAEFDALAVRAGDPLGLRLEALPVPNCHLLAASFGDGAGRHRVQLESGVDVPCADAPTAVRTEDLDGDGDLDVAMVDRVPPSDAGTVLSRWIQQPDGSFVRDLACEVHPEGGSAPSLAPC